MKKNAVTVSGRKLFVVGEATLVEEFSAVCTSKGYVVHTTKKIPQAHSAEKRKRGRRIQSIPRGISLAVELTNIDLVKKKNNLKALDKKLPASLPILTSSVTSTVTEQASWLTHPERLIGFCALPGVFERGLFEVAISVHTSNATVSWIKEFLWSLDREISVIQDRVGMVLPRIICMLINEAAFALMENVAQPEEIDLAMELGANYPEGPIKMGTTIGFDQVVAVLDALQKEVGEDRYRAAPLLRQLSLTRGLWGSELNHVKTE